MKTFSCNFTEKDFANILESLEIAIISCREVLEDITEKGYTYDHYKEHAMNLIELYERLARQVNLPNYLVTQFNISNWNIKVEE